MILYAKMWNSMRIFSCIPLLGCFADYLKSMMNKCFLFDKLKYNELFNSTRLAVNIR